MIDTVDTTEKPLDERGARSLPFGGGCAVAWFADWAWDPKGTYAESAWGGGAGLMIMMFIVLVMAPFNVLWVHALDPHEDQTTRLLCLMVVIPDFFIYLLLRAIVSIVRDRIRFGQPHLAFDAFPFFLGESLDAHVTAKAFAGQEGVVATLRCIDERMAMRHVALTFPLPAQEATHLLRQPALYWELEIRGGTTADVVRFTVPIYARPGV